MSEQLTADGVLERWQLAADFCAAGLCAVSLRADCLF